MKKRNVYVIDEGSDLVAAINKLAEAARSSGISVEDIMSVEDIEYAKMRRPRKEILKEYLRRLSRWLQEEW